jgi:hypothetical protein
VDGTRGAGTPSVTALALTVGTRACGAPRKSVNNKEANMAGMIRKLIASGVAAKLVQEARKPENQAKIKKAIADFQNKNKGGTGRTGRTY